MSESKYVAEIALETPVSSEVRTLKDRVNEEINRSTKVDEELGKQMVSKQDRIRFVAHTETVAEIAPGVMNRWGVVEELEITCAKPEDESVANEYMIKFSSGDKATTLIVPAEWKFVTAPVIRENKTYEMSILDNLAVMIEFDAN